MKHSVDKEEGDFIVFTVSQIIGNTLDFIDTDNDTSKRRTRKRITRKTEDIGRFVDVTKLTVDLCDFGVIGENQLNLLVAQSISNLFQELKIIGFIGSVIKFYHGGIVA